MTKIGDVAWFLALTSDDGREMWQLGDAYPFATIREHPDKFYWTVYIDDETAYDSGKSSDFKTAQLDAENALLDYMWSLNE